MCEYVYIENGSLFLSSRFFKMSLHTHRHAPDVEGFGVLALVAPVGHAQRKDQYILLLAALEVAAEAVARGLRDAGVALPEGNAVGALEVRGGHAPLAAEPYGKNSQIERNRKAVVVSVILWWWDGAENGMSYRAGPAMAYKEALSVKSRMSQPRREKAGSSR